MSCADERAVVVGTGLMARGITAALALAATRVLVVGRDEERAEGAARAARGLAARGADRIVSGPLGPASFVGATLVVETVVEDLAVKREVLERVTSWLSPDATIVTNTSSISIDELAESTDRADRFAGLHFLNPAHATGVVEIVSGTGTTHDTIERLHRVAAAMGKSPIDVRRDVPGFVWNRIQFAVIRECLHLVEAGVADASTVDAAVSDGLAPRWMASGPLATADLGGVETFRTVAQRLFPTLDASPTVQGHLGEAQLAYRWEGPARADVEDLRAEALQVGNAIARRRREIFPTETSSSRGSGDPRT